MSRYINANLLKAEFTGNFRKDYTVPLIKSIIDQQPTADVVEVVRCKDCKYRERTDCFGECSLFKDRDEPRGEMLPNDFCSYGKRRK